jgi:hypothetical protein
MLSSHEQQLRAGIGQFYAAKLVRLRQECRGAVRDAQLLETDEAMVAERLPPSPRERREPASPAIGDLNRSR